MNDDSVTDRIANELGRVSDRLRQEAGSAALYCQLYAAQQALLWAPNPEAAGAPFDVIVAGRIPPLTDTPADSGGCSAVPHPPQSLGTCVPPR